VRLITQPLPQSPWHARRNGFSIASAEIIRFRMLMIAAGYEDSTGPDAPLREPMLKFGLDRLAFGRGTVLIVDDLRAGKIILGMLLNGRPRLSLEYRRIVTRSRPLPATSNAYPIHKPKAIDTACLPRRLRLVIYPL
jgi:hypothetical protein